MRVTFRKSLLLLMTCWLSIVLSGCGQQQIRLVYAGLGQEVTDAKGALKVASNKKIPVTIQGDTSTLTEVDAGGWFLVPPGDMKVLVDKASQAPK